MARKTTEAAPVINSLLSKLERVPISQLKQFPGNPNEGNVEEIAKSLKANALFEPIIVQRSTGYILSHNHVTQAAEQIGWTHLDVIRVDVDDQQAKRIVAAANRTAELSRRDEQLLAELLTGIADTQLGLEGTGYDEDFLDSLLAPNGPEDTLTAGSRNGLQPDTSGLFDCDAYTGADEDEPATPQQPAAPAVPGAPVTTPGTVWNLGDSRLMCGDCRNASHVQQLLNGAHVNLAFTSPPYARQREYDADSGFTAVPEDDYVQWFAPVAGNVAQHLANDGSWFINIKPSANGLDTSLYVMDLIIEHVRSWGWHFATEFCWERPGLPGNVTQRFKNQFEPIYQLVRSRWKMRPEAVRKPSNSVRIPLGKGNYEGQGRLASHQGTGAVLTKNETKPGLAYPGNRLPPFLSNEALGHPAVFPLGLPAFFITAYTDPGDAVYDPFSGTGTTLLAAHKIGRTGYAMELSPAYTDIACARFQRETGIMPVNATTGHKHDFLAASASTAETPQEVTA